VLKIHRIGLQLPFAVLWVLAIAFRRVNGRAAWHSTVNKRGNFRPRDGPEQSRDAGRGDRSEEYPYRSKHTKQKQTATDFILFRICLLEII